MDENGGDILDRYEINRKVSYVNSLVWWIMLWMVKVVRIKVIREAWLED